MSDDVVGGDVVGVILFAEAAYFCALPESSFRLKKHESVIAYFIA